MGLKWQRNGLDAACILYHCIAQADNFQHQIVRLQGPLFVPYLQLQKCYSTNN